MKFDDKMPVPESRKKTENIPITNSVKFTNFPSSPILLRLFKNSASYITTEKNYKKSQNQSGRKERCTYVKALSVNVKEIVKLKDNFLNLSSKKIEDIHRTINNTGKTKYHINMTTKDSSHKQIIFPIGSDNINEIMKSSDKHITNLNCFFKNIKCNTIINFIYINHHGLIITANKVVSFSDLRMVKNYIKNTNSMNSNNV